MESAFELDDLISFMNDSTWALSQGTLETADSLLTASQVEQIEDALQECCLAQSKIKGCQPNQSTDYVRSSAPDTKENRRTHNSILSQISGPIENYSVEDVIHTQSPILKFPSDGVSSEQCIPQTRQTILGDGILSVGCEDLPSDDAPYDMCIPQSRSPRRISLDSDGDQPIKIHRRRRKKSTLSVRKKHGKPQPKRDNLKPNDKIKDTKPQEELQQITKKIYIKKSTRIASSSRSVSGSYNTRGYAKFLKLSSE